MNLTMPIVIGAVLGLGIFALVRALMPSKRSAVAQVARIDAMRARGAAYESAHHGGDKGDAGRLGSVRAQVGARVSEFYMQQGWEQRSLRADLAVLERSWENFLATKVLLAAGESSSARSSSPSSGRSGSAAARSSRSGWPCSSPSSSSSSRIWKYGGTRPTNGVTCGA